MQTISWHIRFFIPLVGLIIYACNISKNRKYANSCGIASLVGLVFPIIIVIIIVVSGGIYSNSLKDNTIFTSSQSISAEEQREIDVIKEFIDIAKTQAKIEFYSSNNKNIQTIIKECFPTAYTITNSSVTLNENVDIKGTMNVKTEKGNTYIVDFSNDKVTKK